MKRSAPTKKPPPQNSIPQTPGAPALGASLFRLFKGRLSRKSISESSLTGSDSDTSITSVLTEIDHSGDSPDLRTIPVSPELPSKITGFFPLIISINGNLALLNNKPADDNVGLELEELEERLDQMKLEREAAEAAADFEQLEPELQEYSIRI